MITPVEEDLAAVIRSSFAVNALNAKSSHFRKGSF
jgi:hypothetical protein